MINYDFINEVLAKFEGKAIPRGYVPCKDGVPLGASGVTIATGVDLGQQTMDGLRSMGVSESTLKVLSPYIGLQKQSAVLKLKAAPLTITPEQVKEIDDAVHKAYIADTAQRFGRERFESVPKEAQAVAVSLCYQFGIPNRPASPSLRLAWDAIRAGSYKQAALHLTNQNGWSAKNPDHRQYLPRRRQEAALLNAIKKG